MNIIFLSYDKPFSVRGKVFLFYGHALPHPVIIFFQAGNYIKIIYYAAIFVGCKRRGIVLFPGKFVSC